MTEKALLKIGAGSFVAGAVLVFVGEFLHPHMQPPGDSAKAFAEYAQSAGWQEIHALQFLAILLLMFGFVALYKYLKNDPGTPAALAWLGAVSAVVTIGIFAALQAVDGYTLKFVVDRWVSAPAAMKDTAFRVAESVRWVEIAFNAYFRIMLGVVLTLFGLAVAYGRLMPKWPGAIAVAAGLASITFGLQVGRQGFAVQGPWGLVALVLELAWVAVIVPIMWRRSRV